MSYRPMPVKIKVNIRQDDIDNGEQANGSKCPISRVVKRHINRIYPKSQYPDRIVMVRTASKLIFVNVWLTDEEIHAHVAISRNYVMPDSLRDFVYDFDKSRALVSPIKDTITQEQA